MAPDKCVEKHRTPSPCHKCPDCNWPEAFTQLQCSIVSLSQRLHCERTARDLFSQVLQRRPCEQRETGHHPCQVRLIKLEFHNYSCLNLPMSTKRRQHPLYRKCCSPIVRYKDIRMKPLNN